MKRNNLERGNKILIFTSVMRFAYGFVNVCEYAVNRFVSFPPTENDLFKKINL